MILQQISLRIKVSISELRIYFKLYQLPSDHRDSYTLMPSLQDQLLYIIPTYHYPGKKIL